MGADALQYHCASHEACNKLGGLVGMPRGHRYFNDNRKQLRKTKIIVPLYRNVGNNLFNVCLQKQNYEQLLIYTFIIDAIISFYIASLSI